MTHATGATERETAAREALAVLEAHDAGRGGCVCESCTIVGPALRAMVEAPATDESPETIAANILRAADLTDSATIARTAILPAVRAGIQAAWESWEPEEIPGRQRVTSAQYDALVEVLDGASGNALPGRILDALGLAL